LDLVYPFAKFLFGLFYPLPKGFPGLKKLLLKFLLGSFNLSGDNFPIFSFSIFFNYPLIWGYQTRYCGSTRRPSRKKQRLVLMDQTHGTALE